MCRIKEIQNHTRNIICLLKEDTKLGEASQLHSDSLDSDWKDSLKFVMFHLHNNVNMHATERVASFPGSHTREREH